MKMSSALRLQNYSTIRTHGPLIYHLSVVLLNTCIKYVCSNQFQSESWARKKVAVQVLDRVEIWQKLLSVLYWEKVLSLTYYIFFDGTPNGFFSNLAL